MKKNLFLISIIIIVIYGLSAVCAADVNETADNLGVSDDFDDKLSSVDNYKNVSDSVKLNESSKQSAGSDVESDDSWKNSIGITYRNHTHYEVSPSRIMPLPYPNGLLPDFNDLSTVSLHKEVVNLMVYNSNDLNHIFTFIRDKDPSWGMLNITLAPNTVFNVCHNGYEDYDTHYAVRFAMPLVQINGMQGSVIHGDWNVFMYVVPNCNVGLVNVVFENFNKCFINSGNLFCLNCTFRGNQQIIRNHNSLCFENCKFNANRGLASLLEAEKNSFNVFYDCNYDNCCKDFIRSNDFSDIVVYSKVPLEHTFDKCDILPNTCLSIISIEKNPKNSTVYDCRYSWQLEKALTEINKFKHSGVNVINLNHKEYELESDKIMDMNIQVEQMYSSCLCVDICPVVINGNGATIKLAGAKKDKLDTFARIGVNGMLIVNNVIFSNFNVDFSNSGRLIVNNCTFLYDMESEDYAHAGFGYFSENYFTNCVFKFNSDYPFSFYRSKVYLVDCDFNTDRVGLSSGSVIYCSYQWMGKFDDKDRKCFNEYHYNGNITYKGYVYNSKKPLVVNIEKYDYFSEMAEYLNIFDPAVMVMNILSDCVIYLEDYKTLEHIIIAGNGHNVAFKPCKIPESLSVTIYNLTFKNYNFARLFENSGSVKFNNCSFISNSFKDYSSSDKCDNCLIYNKGSCVFENCTFTGNVVVNLIVNEGILAISNCSFSDNSVKGSSSKGWFIDNIGGGVFIYNSNFMGMDCSLILHNFNSGNVLISNCSAFNEQFEFSHPEKPKNSKIKNLGLFIGLAVLSLAIGVVSGGVGCALAGSMLVGIFVGGTIACCAAVGLAYAHHVATGSDFLTCVRVFVPLAALGAVIGSVGAAFLNPEYVWPDPAAEVVNLVYEDSSSEVSSLTSTEISEFLETENGVHLVNTLFGL